MLLTKILLISVDDSMASSVITSLSQTGYKVIHTSHGTGAMDLIQVEKPALIILDTKLPDYNSLAIIRSLRSMELNDSTPVILMGSNLREEDALIGLEVGADLCLLETFHPQVFVARAEHPTHKVLPVLTFLLEGFHQAVLQMDPKLFQRVGQLVVRRETCLQEVSS